MFVTERRNKYVLFYSILLLDVPELKQAVSAQLIASPHPYKKDYKEQIVGKGPHDPSIGYPEHDHHRKVGELTSSVSVMHSTLYTAQHMHSEFIRIFLVCCISYIYIPNNLLPHIILLIVFKCIENIIGNLSRLNTLKMLRR